MAEVFDGETALRVGKVKLGEVLEWEGEKQSPERGMEHW